MPRRLDPKKGLPGLFSPGRPKAADMAFLVETPPPKRRRTKVAPAPGPAPDYIQLAPPYRAVPEPSPPLRLSEIPSLATCAVSWIFSILRH